MPPLWYLLGVLFQVTFAASGNLLVAAGMRRQPVWRRRVAAGTTLLTLGYATYASLLHVLPLSVMAPSGAASYLLVAILSRVFLKESVPWLRWGGTWLIAAGVALVVVSNHG